MTFKESYFFSVLLGICFAPLSLSLFNCLTLQLPLCYLSDQGSVMWRPSDNIQECQSELWTCITLSAYVLTI